MSPLALRRLMALPGMAELELKALMKPAYRDPDARAEFPEIDALSLSLFGLTLDDAQGTLRPTDWDQIEHRPLLEQVAAFEAEGWDVTDDKRRPIKMFYQFNEQLWLALRGVAGTTPFAPTEDRPLDWAAKLEREAARFRRR